MNEYEVYLGRIKEVGSNYVYCIESVCDLLNSYSKKMQENKKLSDDDVKYTTPPIVFAYEQQIKDLETKLKHMNRLTEDQAVELQKRGTEINKLKENIEYALFQRECDYGMGDNYIHFTMRKVFSILEECLEVFDETKS